MANSIARMFTPSKSDQSGMVRPMPEPVSMKSAAERESADMKKRKKDIALQSTLMTDPLGSADQANVVKKLLLGQ